MQMIFQDPISSLNPRRKVRDIVMEPLTIWKRGSDAERSRGRRPHPRRGRHRPHAGGREPGPPVLRRSVPAHLDRPVARARSEPDHLRRAGVCARRQRAGPGPQPARGPQGAPRSDADLHRPRPRRRQEHQRPRRRDVPRQAVRGRPQRRAVPGADAPVHERAAGVDPGARSGGRPFAGRRRRRAAVTGPAAVGVPLPPAVPERHRGVHDHRARAARAGRWPLRRLPQPGARVPGRRRHHPDRRHRRRHPA